MGRVPIFVIQGTESQVTIPGFMILVLWLVSIGHRLIGGATGQAARCAEIRQKREREPRILELTREPDRHSERVLDR